MSRHWYRLLPALAVVAVVALICWFLSDFRALAIAASLASCSIPPWFYFHQLSSASLAYYEPGEVNQKWHPNSQTKGNSTRVALIQVCNQPVRHSWYLNALVDRKRAYSQRHGYEYQLASSGRLDGVWAKITVLREKIRKELSRSDRDKIEWIFYSDIDSIIINEGIELQPFLPPVGEHRPFIIAAFDKFGLNAGVFFIKVDMRSLDLLNRALELGETGRQLPFFEQTAMAIAMEEWRLEERGEFVKMPLGLFNSYAGRRAVGRSLAVFQLHFPSLSFKRREMLPLIEDLRAGKVVLNANEARVSAAVAEESRKVWKRWQRSHPSLLVH